MGDGYKGMRIKDDSSNWWTSMVRNQGRDPLVQIVKSDNPLKTFAKLHIPGTDEAEQGMLRFLDPDGGLAQRKMYKDGEWIDEADYDRIRDARAKQKFFDKMDQQRAQRQSGYRMGYGYASGGTVAPGKGGSGMGMGSAAGPRPASAGKGGSPSGGFMGGAMAQPGRAPVAQDEPMRSAVMPNPPVANKAAVMPNNPPVMAQPAVMPSPTNNKFRQTIQPVNQQQPVQAQLMSGIGGLMGGPRPQPTGTPQPAMNWQQQLMAQKQAASQPAPPPPPGYNGTGPGYHGPGMGVMGGAPTGPWAQPQPPQNPQLRSMLPGQGSPAQGSPGKGGGMRQMPAQPPQASPGKGGPSQSPAYGGRTRSRYGGGARRQAPMGGKGG